MPIRRVPVGRLAAVVALGVAVWALAQGGRGPHWRTLRPGLEFATMRGDPFCRRGSSDIGVLRLDPALVRVRVRTWNPKDDRPPTIVEWRRRLGALAVFNAGQYYPGFRYMGLLVSGGDVVSNTPHAEFQGALVARAKPPVARVLDLARGPLDLRRSRWSEVAQSFMLFDSTGSLRVRRSDRAANRTVVAEDRRGRLVVFVSEGAYTLHEFATLLKDSRLALSHAMSMDGGLEAEMVVVAGDFRWASFGNWPKDAEPAAPGALVPLPAVIEVAAP